MFLPLPRTRRARRARHYALALLLDLLTAMPLAFSIAVAGHLIGLHVARLLA